MEQTETRHEGDGRAVVWPTTPTCHDTEPHAATFAPFSWREPGERPFRACSYCGSIHPEDLLAVLPGAIVTLADQKYGYLHKMYVQIINPKALVPDARDVPYFIQVKFYTRHLLELEPPALGALLALLTPASGVWFKRDEKGLAYGPVLPSNEGEATRG